MAKFAYTAIESASGKEKKGSIESASSEQAAIDLKAMGLFPTSLGPDNSASAGAAAKGKKGARKPGAAAADEGTGRKKPMMLGKPVNQKGLMVFTRQLATLVKAGMPMGAAPCLAQLFFTSGELMILFTAVLSCSRIGFGVAAGAIRPSQIVAS